MLFGHHEDVSEAELHKPALISLEYRQDNRAYPHREQQLALPLVAERIVVALEVL